MNEPTRRDFLIELRIKRRLTQAQVAHVLGVSPEYIGMIENAKRNPTLPLALKFEEFYGYPAAQLFLDLRRGGERSA